MAELGSLLPKTRFVYQSDEEFDSRQKKKLRTDGNKHIECDCRHYTLNIIMQECSRCEKSEHGHCYGIHAVMVFDSEHIFGPCSKEFKFCQR